MKALSTQYFSNLTSNEKKSFLAAIAGNILQFYDMTLFGLHAVILTPIFFPQTEDSLLYSFATFGAGFLFRPIGGFFFGFIADYYGRRKALLICMASLTLPTFLIGILPGYQQIGLFSPIFLVVLRLLQGLSFGGELSSAAVYINEIVKKENPMFAGSLLIVTGFLGGILGTTLGTFFTLDIFPEWFWRFSFIFAGVLGLFIFYLRKSLINVHFKKTVCFPSLREYWVEFKKQYKNHWVDFFRVIFIEGYNMIPFYLSTVYMGILLKNQYHFSNSQILGTTSLIMIFWCFILPIGGRIADKIGGQKLMRIASGCLIFLSIPLYTLIIYYPNLWSLIIFQVTISIFSALYVAPTIGILPRLFHAPSRGLLYGLSLNIGNAFIGGMTPTIALWLERLINSPYAPALQLLFFSLIGWAALRKSVLQYEA